MKILIEIEIENELFFFETTFSLENIGQSFVSSEDMAFEQSSIGRIIS